MSSNQINSYNVWFLLAHPFRANATLCMLLKLLTHVNNKKYYQIIINKKSRKYLTRLLGYIRMHRVIHGEREDVRLAKNVRKPAATEAQTQVYDNICKRLIGGQPRKATIYAMNCYVFNSCSGGRNACRQCRSRTF